MKLSDTDFNILELCSQNRETPKNLAAALDIEANYASNELTKLKREKLVTQPGPADTSGMYIVTEKGSFVLSKRSKYDRRQADLFGQLVESAVEIAETLDDETGDQDVRPGDVVITSQSAFDLLHSLQDRPGGFTARDLRDTPEMNLAAIQGSLYELYFFDLLDRGKTSEGVVYDLTGKARTLLDDAPAQPDVMSINRSWNVPSAP
jgi:predicted transcriptional regulator